MASASAVASAVAVAVAVAAGRRETGVKLAAVAARQALLASMRRIRRRRRVAATINGGARSIAWGAPFVAVAVVLAQRFSATAVNGRAAGLLLLAAGAMGAIAAARRRISLLTCARIVDRAWSAGPGSVAAAGAIGTDTSIAGTTDDCVLAAVALAEEGGASTSFVEALTADALGRASKVPPSKVIPPLAVTAVVAAVGGAALLATVILWCPGNRRWASTRIPPTAASGARAAKLNGGGTKTVAPVLLRFAAEDIATEREESSRATAVGHATGDTELVRLGSELARLSADTSTASGTPSTPTAQTMARLQGLLDEAHAAAEVAATATAAATAAARALAAATNVGDAAVGLTEAAVKGLPGSDGAGAAAAAERLVARGDAGRAALRRAAVSAAAALAGADAATATDPQAGGGDANHEDEPRRRLDSARDGEGRGDDGQQDSDSTVGDERRHLQRLRRDLQTAAAGCAADPVQCRRSANAAGRSLADLHRQARTAPARRRLAEAAQQLLDRVRRGGSPSAADSEAMDRFARAAHGKGSGDATTRDFSDGPTGSASARVGVGGGAEANTEAGAEAGVGAGRDRLMAPEQAPLFETGDAQPNDTSGSGSNPAAARSGVSPRLDTDVASARSSPGGGWATGRTGTGAGISAQAAGRVLGSSPNIGGSLAARDAHVHVADGPGGPSRAEIIGAAGARGFASAEYRRVFDDYHSAVEESLDATVVPPGRRSFVRRYFQLIRPRTTP